MLMFVELGGKNQWESKGIPPTSPNKEGLIKRLLRDDDGS